MNTPSPSYAGPSDADKIAAIRAELPAVDTRAYFNAGTNGPMPRRSMNAIIEAATTELTSGRIGRVAYARTSQMETETQGTMALLLGCDPSEVALTHNTSEGMNMAIMGLDWHAGDEVITATTEHPGGLFPIYLLHHRYGVRIRMTGIGLQELDPIAELRKVLTPRTKAVVVSHVSWATGMVLPMREICDLAHSVGAVVICDAAQSCGMVSSKVYDLGVDAYACSGQKWLCGPDGTGALFVRRDRLPDIRQTFIGYRGVTAGMSDYEGNLVPRQGTNRFQIATLYPPSVAGLGASLHWLTTDIGWDWIYARIHTLGQYCYEALSGVPGVTLYSPRKMMAGLVHFTVDGVTPPDLTAALEDRQISIRYTPNPHVNRVSTGFYNTEAEIDHLAEAIREVSSAIS